MTRTNKEHIVRRRISTMALADTRQLSLDLGLPPQASRDTVFFTALPPPEVAEAIAARARLLLSQQRFRIDWRPARVLHVSLAGVGLWDGLPPDALHLARRVGAEMDAAAIPVRFAQALSFGKARRRALVLVGDQTCTPPLATLARTLRQRLAAAGLRPAARGSFTPHVTVGYVDGGLDPVPIEHVPGWVVRDVVLVRSRHGEARHEELGRWALADP
jgi:2'-5' RNA ligase